MARSTPEGEASDERLLGLFLDGDDAMFGELVRRYERPLHGFICRLTGQPGAAADLFQETFLRAFQHAGSFRGRSRFKTWLYAIAANVCRSHARKAMRRRTVSDEDAPEPPDPAPGPNGAAASQEIGERVARAVGTLPASQREVVVLKLYDELTYSEIAQALGRPLGTVKTQMRAALKALRPRLRAIAEAHGLT